MATYQEDIDLKLLGLRQQVDAARRENKQGWSIAHDLQLMRQMLEVLEDLDKQFTSERNSR